MVCSRILSEREPFKHSWDVTSDSIAAYIAGLLGSRLLIATDVDGIYTKDPSLEGAELIKQIDVNELLTFEESSIDLMLPGLLKEYGLDCYVVNGKVPKRVLSIMNSNEENSFNYTFIKSK